MQKEYYIIRILLKDYFFLKSAPVFFAKVSQCLCIVPIPIRPFLLHIDHIDNPHPCPPLSGSLVICESKYQSVQASSINTFAMTFIISANNSRPILSAIAPPVWKILKLFSKRKLQWFFPGCLSQCLK